MTISIRPTLASETEELICMDGAPVLAMYSKIV